jgi:flagellar basal-body rod protein FlgB
MNLADVPFLSMLRERMTWLNQRQGLLTQNVANSDTPGYSARDLKPLDFSQELSMASNPMQSAGQLLTTDPHHIALSSSSNSDFQSIATADAEGGPNGNTVSLEQEMIKVADNQAQFQAATNLYGKAMTMMKTAIGH